MKKITLIIVLAVLTLISCEGSDSYQGKWKAMNAKGEKLEITFTSNSFEIKDSLGDSKEYTYTQNSIQHENGTSAYGIKLKDGRGYQIYFPKSDESAGIISDENNVQMFTISRKEYITYEDLYRLN